MKKTFLLSLLAFLLSSPAWAWYDFEVNGIYYAIKSKSDLTCMVTGLYTSDSPTSNENTYTGKVDIPKTVRYSNNTYSVVAIDRRAFYGCTSLTEVTIPNSVTSIGNYAFYNCSSLTEVTIPNSVTSIGEGMFMDCSSLMEATIPNSVTSIGYRAFDECTSLKGVTIPDSVVSIEDQAFRYCSGLTSVTIGNAVTSIGISAFYGCSSLNEVTIPNSVTSIGNSAFYNCSSLTEVTIGNAVTSIGISAFYNCSSLTEITIPDAVTSIGNSAFCGCSSLEKVAFNATACSSVSSSTPIFYNCAQLSIVEIGENVTMIPAYLFYNYSYLGITEIILPEKLKSVGNRAFDGCSNLSIVTSLNPNPPTCEGYYSNFSSDTYNGILYVPVGTTKAYAKASDWKEFKNIIPLGLVPPTVTTLEATDITYYSATLNGSVVSGNEDILNVGFEFEDGSIIYDTTASYIGEGLFSVTIDDYWFTSVEGNTTYYYRAYAETDSGKYYGEDVSFTTDEYENGINGIVADGAEIVGYYSTDGQRITSPTKGVNIVRLSDGTTKKVLVK